MFMETINQIMTLIGYSVITLTIVSIAFAEFEHYINKREGKVNEQNCRKSMGRSDKKDSKRA